MDTRVVVESAVQAQTAGVTFQEVQAMLQQHRSQTMQELQAALLQERARTLPEVNVMLQKQYLCIKREVEAKLQQERTQTLQQDHTLLLSEVQKRMQQENAATMEKVRTEVQASFHDERSYIFKTMQDLMQQQLTTLSDSTNAELKRLETMIGIASVAFDEQVVRLESNYNTHASMLQDLKQDTQELAKAIDTDRLARTEADRTGAGATLQDVRQTLSGMESRVLCLTAGHDDLNEKLVSHAAHHEDRYQSLLMTVDGHTAKVNEAHARASELVQQSDLVSDFVGQHKEEVMNVISDVQAQVDRSLKATLDQLENARALDCQELTQLVRAEVQARGNLEQALEGQGLESRKLKDRLVAVEKFSEEFAGEVENWMVSVKKNSKRGAEPQSLDRYREIISMREFRN